MAKRRSSEMASKEIEEIDKVITEVRIFRRKARRLGLRNVERAAWWLITYLHEGSSLSLAWAADELAREKAA